MLFFKNWIKALYFKKSVGPLRFHSTHTLVTCLSSEVTQINHVRLMPRKPPKTLREKCPNMEFVWSVFPRIWTKYGDLWNKSGCSVQMGESTDQKKLRIWTLFTQWEHGPFHENCLWSFVLKITDLDWT